MIYLRMKKRICIAGFIEGVSRDQTTPAPERLDDWIGEDHLVRVVLFVDQLDLAGLGFRVMRLRARGGRGIIRLCCSSCSSTAI